MVEATAHTPKGKMTMEDGPQRKERPYGMRVGLPPRHISTNEKVARSAEAEAESVCVGWAPCHTNEEHKGPLALFHQAAPGEDVSALASGHMPFFQILFFDVYNNGGPR